MKLKAIVLYQPWASLVAIGAKPFEFRNRDYRKRDGVKPGDRIAIAAAARPMHSGEIQDLLKRLDDESGSTGLVAELARPFLLRILDYRSNTTPGRVVANPAPMRVIVCTATIGEPKPSLEVMPKWGRFLNDSDRLEHSQWAWPMLDVRPTEPVASRGGQGWFWVSVPDEVAACRR